MAMSSIYEKNQELLLEYEKAFSPGPGQLGALFLLNGRAAGLDMFGRGGTLSNVFPKLVQSYALDAVDHKDAEPGAADADREGRAFLKACRAARMEAFDAVGLGRDARLSSKAVIGFALAFEDRVLHFSAFARRSANGGRNTQSRMVRYTARRRHAR